jgi:hypothetical protein
LEMMKSKHLDHRLPLGADGPHLTPSVPRGPNCLCEQGEMVTYKASCAVLSHGLPHTSCRPRPGVKLVDDEV